MIDSWHPPTTPADRPGNRRLLGDGRRHGGRFSRVAEVLAPRDEVDAPMPTLRRHVVNPDVAATYHTLSRCVRRAFLIRPGQSDRRQWVADQLAQVMSCFAFDLYSFAILGNHVHLVLANSPDRARQWSDREVARRWLTLYPSPWLRRKRGVPVDGPPSEDEISELVDDAAQLEKVRRRLHDLSWFMKCLKEPIARRANREDGVTGHFWEGRYHAFRVCDAGGVVVASAYVDLNEVRAGIAATPEESRFSSGGIRAEQAVRRSRRGQRQRRSRGRRSLLGRIPLAALPEIDERGYLEFLDRSARMPRAGARSLDPTLPPVLMRLGLDGTAWSKAARSGLGRMRGSAAGAVVSVLQEAKLRRRRWVWNAFAKLVGVAARGAGDDARRSESSPARSRSR
jgi:REP element-mobilizing transposase RayT